MGEWKSLPVSLGDCKSISESQNLRDLSANCRLSTVKKKRTLNGANKEKKEEKQKRQNLESRSEKRKKERKVFFEIQERDARSCSWHDSAFNLLNDWSDESFVQC